MAKTREQAQAAREAKLDELHESLTGAVEELVSGPDWARAFSRRDATPSGRRSGAFSKSSSGLIKRGFPAKADGELYGE